MKPYYEDTNSGIVIYHGDCRDVLPTLDPVDLVLTDPPFGVGFRDNAWDQSIPDWLPLARARSSTVIFVTGVRTIWSYPEPDWALCYAAPGSTSRTLQGGFNHWWPILVYGSRKFPTDLNIIPRVSNLSTLSGDHPCPKPELLMRWLIQHGSDPDHSIIDPFMGSGTTLRAAKDLGRKAIGIEIEEKYCEIAAKRLQQAVLPLEMVT